MADFEDGAFDVQVKLQSTVNAHISSITFGGKVAVGNDVMAELTDIRDTYEAALPDILQDMSINYFSTGCRIIWEVTGGGTTSVDLPWSGGALNGATSGSVLDPRSAYVLRKKTVGTGRRGHGRCFVPGVVESKVDDNGMISSAFLTTLNNHVTTFATKLDVPGGGLTSYSLGVNGSLVGGGPNFYRSDLADYNPLTGLVRRRILV